MKQGAMLATSQCNLAEHLKSPASAAVRPSLT
jgi:hypothetical protein